MTNNPHVHHTDGPADEDAYRRGFQQGASAVLEMLQKDVSPTRAIPGGLLDAPARLIMRLGGERPPRPGLTRATRRS